MSTDSGYWARKKTEMATLDPRLVRVEPIGSRMVNAFWDGYDSAGNHVGGFGPIERLDYPPSPRGEALAEIRKSRCISLRLAGQLLGLSPENLSGIEHARYIFRDETMWEHCQVVLLEAEAEKEGGGR